MSTAGLEPAISVNASIRDLPFWEFGQSKALHALLAYLSSTFVA
jgi:hypothetical protein